MVQRHLVSFVVVIISYMSHTLKLMVTSIIGRVWLQEALTGLRPPTFVCFNLGFLPLSKDKQVKTECSTTIVALQAAHDAVADGGCVCVLAYVGHTGLTNIFSLGHRN